MDAVLGRIRIVAVAMASLLVVAAAVFSTRVDFFRTSDDGWWHARLWDVSLVVGPLAVLLLAGAIHWGIRRKWALAALAAPAFPAWALLSCMVPNILANDTWVALVLLQMQGLKPFGAGP